MTFWSISSAAIGVRDAGDPAPRPGPGRRRRAAGRGRAGRGSRRHLGVGDQLAGRGAAQVGVVRSARPAAAAPGRAAAAAGSRRVGERAVEPEVHVHHQVRRRSRGTGACRGPRRAPAPARRGASARSANRPCGLDTSTGSPANRRRCSRASRWTCGPRASGIISVGRQGAAAAAGALVLGEHVDAALVARLAGERGGEERLDDLRGLVRACACARRWPTTLASLCWRARVAVSTLQASAQRTPGPCSRRSARRCRSRR